MSEINDINELPEGIFPIHLKTIDRYQQKDPRVLSKYKNRTYKPVLPVEEVIGNLTLLCVGIKFSIFQHSKVRY